MQIPVSCQQCGKEEMVYKSRAHTYRTCSRECMGAMSRKENNATCAVCNHSFHVKPVRLKRLSLNEITCSIKCRHAIKTKQYAGRKNPNCQYQIDDSMFKNIDTPEKAYLLGWIGSDGSIGKNNSITISVNVKDIDILNLLKEIICLDLQITKKNDTMRTLTFNSQQMTIDICSYFAIEPGKKSHIIQFPILQSSELTWHFLRGYFDGDGSISMKKQKYVTCKIECSSNNMLNSIKNFCGDNAYIGKSSIEWSNKKAVTFLNKLYENSTSKLRLERKYNRYIEYCKFI